MFQFLPRISKLQRLIFMLGVDSSVWQVTYLLLSHPREVDGSRMTVG